VDWVYLAQSRVQWQDFVNMVMNCQLHKIEGNFLTGWVTISFLMILLSVVSYLHHPASLYDMKSCTNHFIHSQIEVEKGSVFGLALSVTGDKWAINWCQSNSRNCVLNLWILTFLVTPVAFQGGLRTLYVFVTYCCRHSFIHLGVLCLPYVKEYTFEVETHIRQLLFPQTCWHVEGCHGLQTTAGNQYSPHHYSPRLSRQKDFNLHIGWLTPASDQWWNRMLWTKSVVYYSKSKLGY
jgi:hypothetical protein